MESLQWRTAYQVHSLYIFPYDASNSCRHGHKLPPTVHEALHVRNYINMSLKTSNCERSKSCSDERLHALGMPPVWPSMSKQKLILIPKIYGSLIPQLRKAPSIRNRFGQTYDTFSRHAFTPMVPDSAVASPYCQLSVWDAIVVWAACVPLERSRRYPYLLPNVFVAGMALLSLLLVHLCLEDPGVAKSMNQT